MTMSITTTSALNLKQIKKWFASGVATIMGTLDVTGKFKPFKAANGGFKILIKNPTAEIFETLKKCNTKNYRAIDSNQVNKLKDEMDAGNWDTNRVFSSFDVAGVTLDGQHRVEAALKSTNPPGEIILDVNLPPEVIYSYDTNKTRDAAQAIAHKYNLDPQTAKRIVSTMKYVIRNNNDNSKFTIREALTHYPTYKDDINLAWVKKLPSVAPPQYLLAQEIKYMHETNNRDQVVIDVANALYATFYLAREKAKYGEEEPRYATTAKAVISKYKNTPWMVKFENTIEPINTQGGDIIKNADAMRSAIIEAMHTISVENQVAA